jgi:hypothetical protein
MVPVANDFAAIARRLKEIQEEVATERVVAAARRMLDPRLDDPLTAREAIEEALAKVIEVSNYG